MYLTNKQIFLLLLPLFIASIVYLFYEEIVANAKYIFPTYKEYKNAVLDKKADIYLKIDAKNSTYETILKKIATRKKEAPWVAATVLYKKTTFKPIPKIIPLSQPKYFHLEAIFFNKKVAIINGKIVYLYGTVDGAKLIRIEEDKVLLQLKKGKRWLYLFD